MIPKYPYRVEVDYRLGDKINRESRNYETLPGAMSYRDTVVGKPRARTVRVMMILDETTKGERDGSSS